MTVIFFRAVGATTNQIFSSLIEVSRHFKTLPFRLDVPPCKVLGQCAAVLPPSGPRFGGMRALRAGPTQISNNLPSAPFPPVEASHFGGIEAPHFLRS